ncbi:hypothetical protein LEP1GSC150_1478 [Leptospira interrogans serovar Copenhageni str. LT2050]|nr:hypothetical protein LEP1GSC150_1478 [Leptospira interrogans serovar Copenhageni str. LT2050]
MVRRIKSWENCFFIHPENDPPEIKKISRVVSQFSYPEDGKF